MAKRLYKYRTGKRRIAASFIDGILLLLPSLIFISNYGWENALNFSALLFYVATFLPVIYSITMHFLYGQTLGKMLFNIKVVNADTEGKITLKQAFLRDSVPLLFIIISLIPLGIIQFIPIINSAESINFWWVLLELITMFTNPKRRAVHDYIAGTVVIKEA